MNECKCPNCGTNLSVKISLEGDGVVVERKQNKKEGFVYLLYSASNNLYKIGRAKELNTRNKSIAKQSPVEVELVHYFKSKDSVEAEKMLHRKYANLRTRGEWFALLDKDVRYIKSISDGGL